MDNNNTDNNLHTDEENEKKDIFDKIMGTKLFKPLEPFYKKNKEVLMYLFFGGLTTVISIALAMVFKTLLENAGCSKHMIATGSTAGSWIFSVAFAYVTNRIWVFSSNAKGAMGILKEMGSFYGGRLATFFVDWGMTELLYTKLGLPYLPVKIAANVIVVILNYVISKLIVFRGKPGEKQE